MSSPINRDSWTLTRWPLSPFEWLLSLGRVLIDCVFSAATAIAHGDPDDINEEGRNGVHHAAKSGGYCASHKDNTSH